ncbi:MAG: DUF4349 domain-containing protein [Acidimicrobiia bacterium]|nr:DUF4349 domain-containing protein [Acidimicrobiia bacterium]
MKRSLFALLALALVLAACTGDDDSAPAGGFADEDSYSTTYAATTTMAPGQTPGISDDGGAAPGDPGTDAERVAALTTANLARMIIFTATIEVEVEDITVANAEVQQAIAGLGGILFGQETTTGDAPRSVLTIKIAPENFDRALERLAGIGDLISQTIYADDVTDRVVDLESRIATSEASVLRLRALLETAPGIEEVVALESELLRRETDLEVLRGQLRTLEDQVALATIVLILSEPSRIPEPAIEVIETIELGHDAACPGRDEVEIDEGEPMTVCFVVTNVGDTALTEIEVWDSGLGLDPDDVVVVEGDLAVALLPGERLVLAYETEADFDRWVSVSVSAIAVDEDDEPIYYEIAEDVEAVELTVIEDTSLPGFTDALGTAWDGMRWLGGVVVLAAGLAIPFLWIPLIAGGVWWWRRRREEE